jgi:hypothetical protein
MQTKYHIEITQKSLEGYFSEKALATIVTANIKQDRFEYQLGHDYIHFDGSAFEPGFEYLANQMQMVIRHLKQAEYKSAWEAFGRHLHSWQDFYSHSNYVKLWQKDHENSAPDEISINDKKILDHPELRSGKNYGLVELLALLPILSKLIKPLMPSDSHAKMNLDSPASGDDFYFAYWAASKQTEAAYASIVQSLSVLEGGQDLISCFNDR